jgi:hypothetical protein
MPDRNSERIQEEAAAAEAARIGGEVSSERSQDDIDEAQRPSDEAGQGEAEGFEEAERELVEHATHGDQHSARRAAQDAPALVEDDRAAEAGEPDFEPSSERSGDTR